LCDARAGWRAPRSLVGAHSTLEDSIRIRALADAAAAATVVLIVLDAVLWFLVFPTGLLEDYVYLRPAPLLGYELAALVATALLLVAVYAAAAPRARGWPAALLGGLLGLLASGPAHLMLFAVVRSNPWYDITRVLWTVASWGVAGATVGWFLNRRPVAR